MSTASPVDEGPVLPDVKVNVVRPTAPVTGRIVSSALCLKGKSASFVRHVAIDVSGTPLAGSFRAGQAFGIIPPGTGDDGKPESVRLYSLACPSAGEDGAGNVISTTAKRVITEEGEPGDPDDHRLVIGACSNYVCDLRPGDEVQVTGPSGRSFLLPADPEAHDYLFIATGTGIAPFRGMIQELLAGPHPTRRSTIDLVMGAAYETDLLYDDLFRRHHEVAPDRFHYHTAISRESALPSGRGRYVDRLLDEGMDHFAARLEDPRTLVYICGIAGMQFGIFRTLARHGYAAGYLDIRDDAVADAPPDTWTDETVKRYVRPGKRCMMSVY